MTPRVTSSEDMQSSSLAATTRRREVPVPPVAKGRRVAMATHEELTNDPIAWPTLALFAGALGVYCLPLLFTWDRPTLWTVPVTVVATYSMFTPMHEAAHRAISAEHRWLNEAVGYVAATVCFQAPFRAFRYIHLSHHKYTNDPQKDPDHWSAGVGPWWLQPFFWCTQNIYYYVVYFKGILQRPRDEALEAALFTVGVVLGLASLMAAGCGRQLLLFVLLPRIVTDGYVTPPHPT